MRKSKKWNAKGQRLADQERATLRHRTKNQYTFLLSRYADKGQAQVAYSSLANDKTMAINKLKELHQQLEDQESSYDEDNVG